jgi:hypothetical protein
MLPEHGIVKIGTTTLTLFRRGHRNREPDAGGQGKVTKPERANWRLNTASLISMAGEFLRFALLNHL